MSEVGDGEAKPRLEREPVQQVKQHHRVQPPGDRSQDRNLAGISVPRRFQLQLLLYDGTDLLQHGSSPAARLRETRASNRRPVPGQAMERDLLISHRQIQSAEE